MGFPINFHNTEKCNKTHQIGWTWEIGTHTFPIVWVIFAHKTPILWYTPSYGKCMGFPINFPWYKKMQQNHSNGENLGNWYSYFSHSMVAFLLLDSYHFINFILWEMNGFLINFPPHWKRQQNPLNGESLRNWFPYSFHKMDAFFY